MFPNNSGTKTFSKLLGITRGKKFGDDMFERCGFVCVTKNRDLQPL